MTYIVVAVIAVVFTLMAGAESNVQCNITHVRNGREPNASTSILPGIIIVPGFAVALTWLLENIHKGVGLWSVVGLFALYVIYWWRNLRKLNQVLSSLTAADGEQRVRVRRQRS